MIFPDITTEEWIKKYPNLSIEKDTCPRCRKRIETTKPYVSNLWIGLLAECECGYDGLDVVIPRTDSAKEIISGIYFSN